MDDPCKKCGGDWVTCPCDYCPRCGINPLEDDKQWCRECRPELYECPFCSPDGTMGFPDGKICSHCNGKHDAG